MIKLLHFVEVYNDLFKDECAIKIYHETKHVYLCKRFRESLCDKMSNGISKNERDNEKVRVFHQSLCAAEKRKDNLMYYRGFFGLSKINVEADSQKSSTIIDAIRALEGHISHKNV